LFVDPAGGKCYKQVTAIFYGENLPQNKGPTLLVDGKSVGIIGLVAGKNKVKMVMPIGLCKTIWVSLDYSGLRTNALAFTYLP